MWMRIPKFSVKALKRFWNNVWVDARTWSSILLVGYTLSDSRMAGILAAIPFVGCIVAIFMILLSIGVLVLHVMCIVKGLDGKRLIVPGVSEFADRF